MVTGFCRKCLCFCMVTLKEGNLIRWNNWKLKTFQIATVKLMEKVVKCLNLSSVNVFVVYLGTAVLKC